MTFFAQKFITIFPVGIRIQNHALKKTGYVIKRSFNLITHCVGKSPNSYIFSGPAIKRGEGKGLATKKKTFFEAKIYINIFINKKFSPKNVATKLEGGTFLWLPIAIMSV